MLRCSVVLSFLLAGCGVDVGHDGGRPDVGSPLDARATDGAMAAASVDAPLDAALEPPVRVLFIGNSYTRYNDVPGLVQALSAAVPEGGGSRSTRCSWTARPRAITS